MCAEESPIQMADNLNDIHKGIMARIQEYAIAKDKDEKISRYTSISSIIINLVYACPNVDTVIENALAHEEIINLLRDACTPQEAIDIINRGRQ